MSNVWAVVCKVPCTGLSTSVISRCHRHAPIAVLAGFAKSITPCRAHSTRSPELFLPRTTRDLPKWTLEQRRFYSKRQTLRTTKDASPISSKVSEPIPSSRATTTEDTSKEGTEELDLEDGNYQPPATVNLSAEQIIEIFGEGTSFDTGMQILQEMQMRRVSGSLQDKGLDLSELADEVTEAQALAGLEYLRDNFPVDEEAAAKEWSQLEIERLTGAIEERAERLGLYRKKHDESDEEADETQPKQVTNVYGESVLVQRQKELKAIEEAEEKKQKEEAEAKGQPVETYRGRDLVIAREQKIDMRRERNKKLAEAHARAAEIPEEQIFAKRTAFSRLWAPTLVAFAAIAGALVFADSYEPPTSSMRVFPSISPAMATCMGIALVNIVVFILWRHPSLYKPFNRNMLMSAGHPIPFSIIGSVFSHQYAKHILNNFLILFLAGPTVCEEIGRGNFIALFLISGIGGNVLSLYYNVLVKNFLMASLGMSGATLGIISAYFLLQNRHFGGKDWGFDYNGLIFFIPMLAIELIKWRKMPNIVAGSTGGGSDHANHVGGIVSGAAMALWLKWRVSRETKAWEEYDAGEVVEEEIGGQSTTPVNVVGKDI